MESRPQKLLDRTRETIRLKHHDLGVVSVHWWTGADEVAIAIRLIDPSYSRPEFVVACSCRWIGCLLTCIRTIPIISAIAPRCRLG